MGDEGELSLDAYKEMTPAQRKSIKKQDLINLLDESVKSGPGNSVETKLDLILQQLGAIKSKNDKYDQEIQRIDNVVSDHSNILSAQQKFLEDLDSEKRAKHLIVLGMKEEDQRADQVKFNNIVETIGVQTRDIKIENIVRLGTRDPNEQNKTRPLKVTLEKREMRDDILKNASKLKEQPEGSEFKKVFLKRDTHPKVREEEKRLYEVWKAEKNKQENVGKEVIFDRKTRVVTCNGDEIDRFRLFTSFH